MDTYNFKVGSRPKITPIFKDPVTKLPLEHVPNVIDITLVKPDGDTESLDHADDGSFEMEVTEPLFYYVIIRTNEPKGVEEIRITGEALRDEEA